MTKTKHRILTTFCILLFALCIFCALAAVSVGAEAAADLTVTIDTGASVTLKDADGDGFYDIGTADELYAFEAAVNSGNPAINGELTANIVLNENVLKEDGTLNGDGSNFRVWTPIGYHVSNADNADYAGTFDGAGFTVSGLYCNDSAADYVGLFGYVDEGGTVKNVGVIDAYVIGNEYVGGVVGRNHGTVQNCYNTGTVSSNINVGGLIGYNRGSVADCHNTGTVTGTGALMNQSDVGGLIGDNTGTVQNCYNTGTVNGKYRVGGVVGSIDNSTVQNCYNTGTVNGTFDVGGVAGVIDIYAIVQNCHNSGTVSSTESAGGVIGTTYSRSNVQNCYNTGAVNINGYYVGGVIASNGSGCTVQNCYSTGTISDAIDHAGGVAGVNFGTITNCYYLTGTAIGGIEGADAEAGAEGRTEEQFKSGEVAFLLNGGVTDGTQTFYQTIGVGLPIFSGETVYRNQIGGCNEESFSYEYSNTAADPVVKHQINTDGDGLCIFCGYGCPHPGGAEGDKAATCSSRAYCAICKNEYGDIDKTNHEKYTNGFCVCGEEEAAVLNEDGYYEIANAGQLFWFANHVNTVDRTASAVLAADIDLENRPWTPIGSTGEQNHNFRGVFDGQNHTIKGLYVEGGRAGLGFFGEVRTGTVKNFTIYGEVIVNTQHDYVGGVIGSICGVNGETVFGERNGAIIQNITSYVNLTAKAHGVGMIGGFVGYANHQSLIENCSWYGTFDAGIYRVDSGAGGFIGKIQENTSEVTIRNCAAYGTIKTNYEKNSFNNTPTIYMGGFLSFSNTGAKTTLENCLFAGKFERGENLTDEARLGAFGTLRSVNSIKNCYYLGDGVLEAVHSDSNLKPGSDNVEITSVTKAQLLSGEVAYKLGEHFGQILEGENRQSYPVLGGTKVQDSQRFEIYGQQLGIGADLSMKYYVMGYASEFNSKGLYMEFSHNGVKTKVYAGEPNADGFYVFILEGINPQCMGDSIRAMLYYNETEVTSHGCEDGKEYSVEKNLLNLLEKYKDDAALVTLIKDTLAYGEAASAFTGHQTMTGTSYAENGSQRKLPEASVTLDAPFVGYTVRFGVKNYVKIGVTLTDGNRLYLNGEEITDKLAEDGTYTTAGIAPTDFATKYKFEVRASDGTTAISELTFCVNDYAYVISQSTDTSEHMKNMKALAKALYNYGVSAKDYVHILNGDEDHMFVYTVYEDGTHTKTCVCGEKVTENHSFTYIDNDNDKHTKICVCGKKVDEKHTFDGNSCPCGYTVTLVGFAVSNGTVTEDISVAMIGRSQIDGYSVKTDGAVMTVIINAAGLTLSGTLPEGYTIDIRANATLDGTTFNNNVTIHDVDIDIKSNVQIHGDLVVNNSSQVRIYGTDGAKPTVTISQKISVSGMTVFENIDLQILTPPQSQRTFVIFGSGSVSFVNATVFVQSGLIATLTSLNGSTLTFGAESGFDISVYEQKAVITLTNHSKVEFYGTIIGAFYIKLNDSEPHFINHDPTSGGLNVNYYWGYDTFEAWYDSLGDDTWLFNKDESSTMESHVS